MKYRNSNQQVQQPSENAYKSKKKKKKKKREALVEFLLKLVGPTIDKGIF
jgi:ribosomal protein L20